MTWRPGLGDPPAPAAPCKSADGDGEAARPALGRPMRLPGGKLAEHGPAGGDVAGGTGTHHADRVRAEPVARRSGSRFGRLPWLGRGRAAFNADRLLNRLWHYPRWLRGRTADFDLFHVCDHSYAQLVHVLPTGRTGVFCHDLDAFRCLLEPAREPRPFWFRAVARTILRGLQQAAVVFHSTLDVRERILRHGLIDPGRLVHAPYGISPEFTPCRSEVDEKAPFPTPTGRPFLLHVGSCIPRKRIDVLLDVFASVRRQFPGLRSCSDRRSMDGVPRGTTRRWESPRRSIQSAGLSRDDLAALYRARGGGPATERSGGLRVAAGRGAGVRRGRRRQRPSRFA